MPNAKKHVDITFLRAYNIMNDHMISYLIHERNSFAQKNSTNMITKDECIKLINIELEVLKMCNSEVEKIHIPERPYPSEVTDAMSLMCNRIDHLFFSMFQAFSFGCVELVGYMEFKSKNVKFTINNPFSLITLMSNINCEPQIYVAAATFEYEKHNIEEARLYLSEGIKNHSENKYLYLEQLWIEVMYLGDVGGGGLNEILAIQSYKNTIQKFEHDMEFHILLLDRAIELKLMMRLQYEIANDLIQIYKYSDVMWHKVAILCSEGFIFDHDLNLFKYVTDFNERARCCILTYYEGLKHVINVVKKRYLMKLLSEYIVKLWKYNKSVKNVAIDVLVKREMKRVFQESHFQFGSLHKPEYYVYWALIGQDDRPEVLQLATDRNQDNVYVWTEVLEFHVVNFETYETIKNIFDVGNRVLGSKSLPLWEIMESFLQHYCDHSLLGKFYKDGANSSYKEISKTFKANYLEWCHTYDGIDSAREVFKQLTKLEPECKKLYMDMIEYEKLQRPINVQLVRNLYNLACSKFCHQGGDISLWTDCIEFELMYVGSVTAELIYQLAMKIVKPHLRSYLRNKYHTIIETHRRSTASTSTSYY